jgi:hypothetical protein
MNMNGVGSRVVVWLIVILMAVPPGALAQEGGGKPVFKQEELDQMLAPIALYPDSLLAQVLMASTYPLEVVQASRWAQQNKDLKGDALTAALERQEWDPSVKSLVNFPQVLDMMSDKLDWTQKLGDAFLADEKAVSETIQKLRAKADAQGNLKTTEQQTVIVEKETQIIRIEPASPQVVYVPTYNPTVVYGTWWWPSCPPYYWPPPPYYYPGGAVAAGVIGFGLGVAVGAAWGYAWGGWNWRGGNVNIDINRNTNINRNINRGAHAEHYKGGQGSWKHDPSHRKGVSYRDQGTAQRYNRASTADAARARENYRGRAEAGRQDLARGGADQFRGRQDAGQRGGFEARDRAGRGDLSSRQSSGRGSAFEGGGRGSDTRSFSDRGRSSRESMSSSRSGGGSRGSSFSGGGGSRGGGGGGARGGGGGGRR